MKKNNKSETYVRDILASRLQMQTIQRYLLGYEISPDADFLESTKFKSQYNTWPAYKKKNFLVTVGGIHWKKVQEIIER